MSEKNKRYEEENTETDGVEAGGEVNGAVADGSEANDGEEQPKRLTWLYVAIGCLAVAAVLFGLAIGLSYAVQGVGVYLVIASMISALAAVSFTNGQKRVYDCRANTIVKFVSYGVMLAGLAMFLIGTVVNASVTK